MHDLPPVQTAPAAQRNRRSGRSAPARRGGRRKKRPLITWPQIAVLLVLAAGVAGAMLSQNNARRALDALHAQREREKAAWEQEVGSHQVKYREWIEYYAAANGLDPAYVAAIIKRESDYDPRAVSRKGAMGLMQFMPDTFEWVAPNCGISKSDTQAIYEPENAIKMGCYLLRYIIRQLGSDDPVLVACAYHAGWGNVKGWVDKYSANGKTLALSEIPMDDTRYYAGKVLNAYAIYQQYHY